MKKILIFCVIFLVLMGCKDDPKPVNQFLANTDMETGATSPTTWWNQEEKSVYSTEWTTEEASSGTRSLKIRATQSDATNFAFWAQSYSGTIPVGENVVLSVKVKCKNVMGRGVSIVIRADNSNGLNTHATQFSTTEGKTTISGDFDWTTYQVHLGPIQSDIKTIVIYLIFLDNTVGTVYFDDASLMVQ